MVAALFSINRRFWVMCVQLMSTADELVLYVRVLIGLNHYLSVYIMPYEDDDDHMDEFVNVLALVEDINHGYSDCNLVLGGDFNVDSRRDRSHTALLNGFCEDAGLIPSILHSAYRVDYTYSFNMSRFSILDHFILYSALYNKCMADVSVLHDINNLSDHEPLLLQLNIDVTSSTLHSRTFIPHVC